MPKVALSSPKQLWVLNRAGRLSLDGQEGQILADKAAKAIESAVIARQEAEQGKQG